MLQNFHLRDAVNEIRKKLKDQSMRFSSHAYDNWSHKDQSVRFSSHDYDILGHNWTSQCDSVVMPITTEATRTSPCDSAVMPMTTGATIGPVHAIQQSCQ